MNAYQSVIHRLFQLHRLDKTERNLDHMQELHKRLFSPAKNYQTIHVAGTNGKGSIATQIAFSLQKGGYCVGLFTSPHLVSYRERIRINGEMISEEEVVEAADHIAKLDGNLSFFDTTTLMALRHFAKEGVEVAVIEAGIGGRLDSTNIITPTVSIITSLGLDHVEILGGTLSSIAWEKSGIIKPGVPVVLGPTAQHPKILEKAEECSSKVISVSFQRNFEEENRAIARAALQESFPHVAFQEGVKVPARFDVRGDVIYDVAHNPAAIERLVEMLKSRLPDEKFSILTSFSKEKNVQKCFKLLSELATTFYLTKAHNPRSLPIDQLEAYLTGIDFASYQSGGIEEMYEKALGESRMRGEKLLIVGSFYLIGDVLNHQTSERVLPQ